MIRIPIGKNSPVYASEQDRRTLRAWAEKWSEKWSEDEDLKIMKQWVWNDHFPLPTNPPVTTRQALQALSRLGGKNAGL